MKFQTKVIKESKLHVEMDLTKDQAAILMFRIDASPAMHGQPFIDELYKGLATVFDGGNSKEYNDIYDKLCAQYDVEKY